MNRLLVLAIYVFAIFSAKGQLMDDTYVFANCEHLAYVIDVPIL